MLRNLLLVEVKSVPRQKARLGQPLRHEWIPAINRSASSRDLQIPIGAPVDLQLETAPHGDEPAAIRVEGFELA